MDPDTRRILVARGARGLAYGVSSVLLAIHLARLGHTPATIGLLLGLGLAGSVAVSVAFAWKADHWGRRRSLVAYGVAMAAAGACFALSSHPLALALACLSGTLSATAGEAGPFLSLEQAALAGTNVPQRRLRAFALYNVVGSLSGASGALLVSALAVLGASAGLLEITVGRVGFALYAALGGLAALVLSTLSPAVERGDAGPAPSRLPLGRSRKAVLGLAALFSVDALAGGLVLPSVIALWFERRFALSLEALGAVFFAANSLAALSFLLADRVARRVGLLNTMVLTHLPSNVLLAAVPLMPTAPLAIATLLARQAISQMDVPTRQAFVMELVEPHERVAAASVTNTVRSIAAAAAPALSGLALQSGAAALPFVLAGAIKAAYDVALWAAYGGRASTRRSP